MYFFKPISAPTRFRYHAGGTYDAPETFFWLQRVTPIPFSLDVFSIALPTERPIVATFVCL